MSLISILTTVVIAIILIGIGLGFLRGWQRSLIRFGIVLASLLISIFIAPLISSWFMSTFVSGSTITIFSKTIDFQVVINNITNESFELAELFAEGSATNELILSVMNIIINIFLFLIMFIGINLVSLIVYWIVLLILKVHNRNEVKEPVVRNGKFWGLRSVGGVLGMLGSMVICFVVLTPLFGVMNICDGLVQSEVKTEQKANAYGESFICGNLYYTEDKNIGKIEGYIEKYATIKNNYDSSFLGKFLKVTGLKKLGTATFEKLTTVKQGGLKLNLTDEFIQITKVYNAYKETFVQGKFDVTDNEDIDAVVEIYDLAVESEIMKNYVTEIIPNICEKWSSGEKYLGIPSPISGVWSDVVVDALVVFKVDNINRISSNLKALANTVKVANDYGVIKSINENQKVEDLLGEKDNFIKDEVLVLTSTNELRENISIILNDAFEVLYVQVVEKDIEFEDNKLTVQEIAEMNVQNSWQGEAESIQNTVTQIFGVYDVVKEDSSSEVLLNKLQNIGAAIDSARDSRLISKPFKTFIVGFIQEKVNLDEDVKTEILEKIETKWDDETFVFETTFKTIQDAAIVAKNISDNKGDVSLSGMKDSLKDLISNESAKDSIASMLESNIINSVVGEENQDTANVLTDVLGTLVTSDKVTNETLDDDVKAGEQVVNIVTNVKNNNGNLNLGETEAEKQASADKIVEDLTASEGMMEMLNDSANSTDGSAITDFTKNVSEEDKVVLAESISNSSASEADKETLKKLFGIA